MKNLPWALFGLAVVAATLLAFQLQKESADNAALGSQVHELQTDLATAKQIENLKALPLTLTVRQALTGSGKVVNIENRGGEALRLQIVLESAGGERKTTETVLDPNQMTAIGHLEGWAFIAGDQVSISSVGYRTQSWKVK